MAVPNAKFIITNAFRRYVSKLIKDGQVPLYFGVGLGVNAWDNTIIPDPSLDTTRLVNEVYRNRVDLSKIEYVNPINLEEIVQDPTSTVRIEVEITNNEYYGICREYGLFYNSDNGEINTGEAFIYCCHPRIHIPSDTSYLKHIYINT